MTGPAPDSSLRHPLERQHRRHQSALLWRIALRGAATCALAVAVAVALGAISVPGEGAAWTRTVLLGLAGSWVIARAARRFAREGLTLDAYLERVELRFPHLRSWLRNAVDFERTPPSHVSPDLSRALRAEAEQRLEQERIDAIHPRVAPARPAWVMAGALVLVTLLGVVWPARTQRSWATLWNPGAAAPPVRLEVEPGSVAVTSGASLAVRARVWGTERAPRLEREPGTGLEAVAEGREGGARIWRFDLAQLTRAQDYWVRVAGAKSPRYRIALSGSLSPVGFEVEYRSPAYARMPAQRGTSSRGDLTALKGTEATLVVTFDRDLETLEARVGSGEVRAWEALTPRRWRGVLAVDRDGEYELSAAARTGAGDPGPAHARFRYRITALADAPPVLLVQRPEGDVDLPAGQRIPLDVVAQDDLGLTELTLQFRRDPAGPWTDLPLSRFPARPRDARVETGWDASSLGLLPGQSATFRLVLFDDNQVSGRGRTVSPTFELRFPSLADLYENVDERQAGAQRTLERVADQARELQKTLDKLARQQPRQESAPSTNFERSEELRSAMQRQREIGQQLDQAAEELRQSLEQAAERDAFDQELMRKLREVHELLAQIESQELKEAMRKMQEALEKLDRRALERQIPDWRAENREMLENLERTLELLKKLREEEQLQSLAQRAEELKAQQDELNREHQAAAESQEARERPTDQRLERDRASAQERAERQERAAAESEALSEEVREQSKQSSEAEAREQLEQAAKDLTEGAASSQREAASSAQQGQSQQARRSGERASEKLSEAAARMQRMMEKMQADQNQLDLAAVRRAAQDLVSLQRAAESNLDSGLEPRAQSDRQTDLSEGTSRVADSLFQLSRQTPFISPTLSEALGRAINGLGESGRELAGGNRARGEESGRQAAQSLNEAVLELRAAEGAMCNQPGGGSGGRLNPRRVGEVSERQSQLNQETRKIARQLTEQLRLSSGDREQLERLAREQERIRREVEEIRRDEQSERELLGRLDQTERDMKEVEEVLRSGNVDGTLEEKQQRILSRLLDAQRSVNRRDFDPQRESRTGEEVARESPQDLPAELLRQGDRFRQDLLKSELDRYPGQYRAFVEAYLRLLNGSRR